MMLCGRFVFLLVCSKRLSPITCQKENSIFSHSHAPLGKINFIYQRWLMIAYWINRWRSLHSRPRLSIHDMYIPTATSQLPILYWFCLVKNRPTGRNSSPSFSQQWIIVSCMLVHLFKKVCVLLDEGGWMPFKRVASSDWNHWKWMYEHKNVAQLQNW